MNQYSREIHDDLQAMSKKYGITRILFLFEERDKDNSEKLINRVILFDPALKELSICVFAHLVERCLSASKTLQDIIQHVNMHAMKEIMKDQVFNESLNTPDDKKILN
jgi:hypothetical protein